MNATTVEVMQDFFTTSRGSAVERASLLFLFLSSAMLVLPAYAILAVGPALALYCVFIGRRRPFLFLVTLAR